LVAVEVVKTLLSIDPAEAREVLNTYQKTDAGKLPHRARYTGEYLFREGQAVRKPATPAARFQGLSVIYV
jgi:glycogen debranching enzyme